MEELKIDVDDAERAGRLSSPHRDPFDRVLIAQAKARNLPIVSTDRVFDRYGVQRIW
ncbi:MAG: type II toxin-antitoxin system VapC family toxin [Gammaproteobacteria bacterium]|nr:type II toxin-antitoxin system VapC family toxin [Gammaproteobacteria bacterium]MYE80535.1 type II toxin-antitoxin system VapC family toxin [Gammaproteobacteria bacterium]